MLSGCAKAEKQSTQVKNNIIKKMKSPDILFFKDNLFLMDNDKMVIVSVDGKKISKRKTFGENLIAYAGEEYIALIDKNKDTIYFLDDKLKTVKEYSIDIHGETDLSYDLKTLYTFDYYNGIYKTDLETLKEELIYKYDSSFIQSSSKNYISFKNHDENKEYLLNKETGEISENINPIIYESHIIKDGKTYITTAEELKLTSDGKYFYYYNTTENRIYLYNLDFSLASYAKVPDKKPKHIGKIKLGKIIYNEENSDFIIEFINILEWSEFYYWKPDFSLTGSGLWVEEYKTD